MPFFTHETNLDVSRRRSSDEELFKAFTAQKMKKMSRETIAKSVSGERAARSRMLHKEKAIRQLLLSIALNAKKLTGAEHAFLTGKEVVEGYRYIILLLAMKADNKLDEAEYASLLRLAREDGIIFDVDFESLIQAEKIAEIKKSSLEDFFTNNNQDDFKLAASDENIERRNTLIDVNSLINRGIKEKIFAADSYAKFLEGVHDAFAKANEPITEEDKLFAQGAKNTFNQFTQEYFNESADFIDISHVFFKTMTTSDACGLILISNHSHLDEMGKNNNSTHFINGLLNQLKMDQGFIFDGLHFYYIKKDSEIFKKIELQAGREAELKVSLGWSIKAEMTFREARLSAEEIEMIVLSAKPTLLWNENNLEIIEKNSDHFNFSTERANLTTLIPSDIFALPLVNTEDDQRLFHMLLQEKIDFKADHFKGKDRAYFIAAIILKKFNSSIETFNFAEPPYQAAQIAVIDAVFHNGALFKNEGEIVKFNKRYKMADLLHNILTYIAETLKKNGKTKLSAPQLKAIKNFILEGYPYSPNGRSFYLKSFNLSQEEDMAALKKLITAVIQNQFLTKMETLYSNFTMEVTQYAFKRQYSNPQNQDNTSASRMSLYTDAFIKTLSDVSNCTDVSHQRAIMENIVYLSSDEIEKLNTLTLAQLHMLLSPQLNEILPPLTTWTEKFDMIKQVVDEKLTKNEVIFILNRMKITKKKFSEVQQVLNELEKTLSKLSIDFSSIKEEDLYAILYLMNNEEINFEEAYKVMTETLSFWQASYVRSQDKKEFYTPLNWVVAFSDKDHFKMFMTLYENFSMPDENGKDHPVETKQLFNALASLLPGHPEFPNADDTQGTDVKYVDYREYTYLDYMQNQFPVEWPDAIKTECPLAFDLFNKIITHSQGALMKPEWKSFMDLFIKQKEVSVKQMEEARKEEQRKEEEKSEELAKNLRLSSYLDGFIERMDKILSEQEREIGQRGDKYVPAALTFFVTPSLSQQAPKPDQEDNENKKTVPYMSFRGPSREE